MIVKRNNFPFRDQFSEITKVNNEIYLKKSGYNFFVKFLRRFKSYRNSSNKFINFDIYWKNSLVGYLQIDEKSTEEINLMWAAINEEYQGHKIFEQVLRFLFEKFIELGYKKVTLEVPGNALAAQHIYQKLGFKKVKYLGDDPIWDGLTSMELNLKSYDSKEK